MNTLIRWGTAAVVLAVASFAAVVSYSHIYELGRAHGQAGTAARLLPLSVDGLIVAASLVLLHEARNGSHAPPLARSMLWLGIGATVGANVAYGAAYGPLGAVISAWPAVAFIGAAEMAIGMVRSARRDHEPTPAQTAPAVASVPEHAGRARPVMPRRAPERSTRRAEPATEHEAELAFSAVVAEGQVPSLRQVKAEMHVGTDRARALRDHLAQLVPVGGDAA